MSKWAEKVLGLALVEPAISSASFGEWGETKVMSEVLCSGLYADISLLS